jgi:hypothetical protein
MGSQRPDTHRPQDSRERLSPQLESQYPHTNIAKSAGRSYGAPGRRRSLRSGRHDLDNSA